MTRMLGALGLLLALGCNAVYSPQPVGEKAKDLSAVAAEWEGTWLSADGHALVIGVADGPNGVLKVEWIEEDREGSHLTTVTVYLRDAGTWTIASFKDPDKPSEARYLFARVHIEDRQILLWLPDAEKIEPLIASGQLPGEKTGSDLQLGPLSPEQLALLTSEKHGVLFDWDEPLVLRKSSL